MNGYMRDRLRDYNNRDTKAIRRHIRGLRDALEQDAHDVVHPLFGGSISKHTYVDGLSDIDVLMVINDSKLSDLSPKAAIQHMVELIEKRMPNIDISAGRLAVTVKYADGNEVQVLPAIRTKAGVKISATKGNAWSRILHPERFAEKLTKVNQSNAGQVIPTIKLVKVLLNRSVQSDRGRITGYHIESLAIEAFENYCGPNDLKSMIDKFMDFASKAVKQPIKDATGQSRYIDEYLGPPGSDQRKRASKILQQIQRNIDNCISKQDLDNLFSL